jgi:hypothetical protein
VGVGVNVLVAVCVRVGGRGVVVGDGGRGVVVEVGEGSKVDVAIDVTETPVV